MKTKISLFTLLSSFAFVLSAQTTITLTPTKDASVGFHDGYASDDTNYGGSTHYSAFSQPSATSYPGENAGWGIMGFDLSSIPEGATIIDAKLDLYHFGAGFSSPLPDGHAGNNKCWLVRITEDWNENTVTWNTKPAITTEHRVTLPKSTDPDQDYLDINVTSLVQDMIDNPAESFGFCLKLKHEHPTIGLMFASTDFSDSDRWPSLEITYTTGLRTMPGNEAGMNDANIFNDEDDFSIKLFPNPTSDNFNLQIDLEKNSYVTIELKDITSKSLLQQSFGELECGTHTLEVTFNGTISPGIYILDIMADNKRKQIKVIVTD